MFTSIKPIPLYPQTSSYQARALLNGEYAHQMMTPKLAHERLVKEQHHQMKQQQQQMQMQAAQTFSNQTSAPREFEEVKRKEEHEEIQIQHITDGKKKRGRPKKLILDPSTNEFIDSSHPNFKNLNKALKDSLSPSVFDKPRDTASLGRLYDQPTYMRTFEDEAVKQLLMKKDRRGRPRKFPVEQTGVTIKGIRVNGTMKSRVGKR